MEREGSRSDNKTQVITLANQKGGCGKSTATLSLAAALAHLGHSSCVIDCDPQCNITDHLGLNREMHMAEGRATLADVVAGELYAADALVEVPAPPTFAGQLIRPLLLPGHQGMGMIERRLEAASNPKSPLDLDEQREAHRLRLRQGLLTMGQRCSFCLIDTAPTLDFLMTVSLIAADWVIIPIFPSGYDLLGLEALLGTVEKVRARYNPQLRVLGVLVGNFTPVAKLDREIRRMLQDQFGEDILFDQAIHRSVRHREAPLNHLTIFEHAPGQAASKQYQNIAEQMLTRMGMTGGSAV